MRQLARFLCPILLLSSLSSCGGEKAPNPVFLDCGSLEHFGAAKTYSKEEAYTPITYSKLNSLIAEEGNFLFLARGSTDTCACWQDFLNNCLGPYVRAKHLLVYEMDVETLEKEKDHYGIPLFAGYDSLAIFENGKLAHSKSYAEDEKWGRDTLTFNQWMNARILAPKRFRITFDQLDTLYEGKDPFGQLTSRFAVAFGRDTCPDCSYLFRHDVREYFDSRTSASLPLYYVDFDIYRNSAEYEAKKVEYGLASDDEHPNPLSYAGGAFPAIMSVIPNAGEKIDTIDQMGVFYNDTVKDGFITASYFSKKRTRDPESGLTGALSYAANVVPNVLEGVSVDGSKKRQEALHPYHYPLLKALLDEIL